MRRPALTDAEIDRLLDGIDDMDLDDPDDPDDLGDLDAEVEAFIREFPPPPPLPPDLEELARQIQCAANLRLFCGPDCPWHIFEGFEARACVIGGMGLVIEGRDPVLQRKVAIKLWQRAGPQAQMALLVEAQTLARLSHRNVVSVYETGCWGDRVFFVMEWIDGVDGHEWMQTARRWRAVRDVFVDAGRGLAAAHDAGIQHRDFKPANMLIGHDGRVVVADFGVADPLDPEGDSHRRDPGDPGDPERSGPGAGTPTYMAPERLRGGPGDARSDQFSFCAAMWRALFGLRPFAGETAEALLEAMADGRVRTEHEAEVPGWLRQVVEKGLAVDPDGRHADMHVLVQALLDEPSDEGACVGGVVERGGGERGRDGGGLWNRGGQRAVSRWAFVASMLAVCVGVLVADGVRRSAELAEDGPRAVEEQVEVAPLPESPCAGVEPGERVDPVVFEVCGLIRNGHLEAADMLWEREFNDRASDDPNLGHDVTIIAATFVEGAERLAALDGQEARLAAQRALFWSGRSPDAVETQARAKRILANDN
jgi:hypothetical protein